MAPAQHIEISEDVSGVYIASCKRCESVVAVRHSRKAIERDAGFHCCPELETFATPSFDRRSLFLSSLWMNFFGH
jgi:hypothetical protein